MHGGGKVATLLGETEIQEKTGVGCTSTGHSSWKVQHISGQSSLVQQLVHLLEQVVVARIGLHVS